MIRFEPTKRDAASAINGGIPEQTDDICARNGSVSRRDLT